MGWLGSIFSRGVSQTAAQPAAPQGLQFSGNAYTAGLAGTVQPAANKAAPYYPAMPSHPSQEAVRAQQQAAAAAAQAALPEGYRYYSGASPSPTGGPAADIKGNEWNPNWWVPYVAQQMGVSAAADGAYKGQYLLPQGLSVAYDSKTPFYDKEMFVDALGGTIQAPNGQQMVNLMRDGKSLGALGMVDQSYMLPKNYTSGSVHAMRSPNLTGETGLSGVTYYDGWNQPYYEYRLPTAAAGLMDINRGPTANLSLGMYGSKQNTPTNEYFIPYNTLQSNLKYVENAAPKGGGLGFGTIASLAGTAMGLPALTNFGRVVSAAQSLGNAGGSKPGAIPNPLANIKAFDPTSLKPAAPATPTGGTTK